MKIEVLSLVWRLDCLSCVLTVLSTILVGRRCWTGWGDSGGQQPDRLCHRIKNRATGLNSGKPVLYCALRGSTFERGARQSSHEPGGPVNERYGDITTVASLR